MSDRVCIEWTCDRCATSVTTDYDGMYKKPPEPWFRHGDGRCLCPDCGRTLETLQDSHANEMNRFWEGK